MLYRTQFQYMIEEANSELRGFFSSIVNAIISKERSALLTFFNLNQNHVTKDYADRWHVIKNTYVKEDHINEQHVIWNLRCLLKYFYCVSWRNRNILAGIVSGQNNFGSHPGIYKTYKKFLLKILQLRQLT